ncbi:hypothetical protein CHLRE_16g660331v5 [Chlamydomonas reinhardtii]|uniref:Uncharacterized protein n=1 Tax=Chlamydomonas reinhardtii TaxID=3055 RepID=A0A2K3CTG4_CHLRE|nr:uncharacterized protein CHLRE_16g660331v5 [Chlamydomonas reinhardtii]PNW71584.1 hypothetical protein CHLRE_16g660331v5 [Chlamydomonas reinhardtii]
MVGILDGEALEARPDLETDLQVPLVSMDLQTPAWGEGAPTMELPLEVYRFGDEGSLVAAPEAESMLTSGTCRSVSRSGRASSASPSRIPTMNACAARLGNRQRRYGVNTSCRLASHTW